MIKEKPDYSRPTFWVTYEKTGGPAGCYTEPVFTRARIIYPDGKAEWADGFNGEWVSDTPCWGLGYFYGPYWVPKSAQEAVKIMKAYDKREGRVTVFCGNL